LGEPLRMIAAQYREGLLVDMGLDPDAAPDGLFVKETTRFMNQMCRHLGDRHAGDARVAHAMEEWVRQVDEYDAFDVLLSHFDFEARQAVLRRGRNLFPGPLTAHWGDRATEP
jgi:hypothetical protein